MLHGRLDSIFKGPSPLIKWHSPQYHLPIPSLSILLICALASVSLADGTVFAGRVASTTESFYDSGSVVSVLLRVPQLVIAEGICVDLVPIQSQFEATTLTNCTSSLVSLPFTVDKPGVYYVQVRMRTEGQAVDVWGQRAVVVTMLAGNLSMADSMIAVLISTIVIVGVLVFVCIPLKLMPLPALPVAKERDFDNGL